jgi:hypothetical protein
MTLRSTLLGVVIALVGCSETTYVLDQKASDGVTGTFDGKVMRSTHAQVAEGTRCTGTLNREKASPTAQVTIRCGALAVYEGTGAFTIAVGDPTRRDDDASEFHDRDTSDRDRTPGVRIIGENAKADGSSGTLDIWDVATGGAPAFEIAIVL